MKKTLLVLVIGALVAVALFADGVYTGSDYVRMGKLGSINGTLAEEGGEWYLETAQVTYEVHLGNYEVLYPDGLGLEAGAQATVQGFIYEDQVSAVSVTTAAGTWKFRSVEGTPLWAGRGQGQNARYPNEYHD